MKPLHQVYASIVRTLHRVQRQPPVSVELRRDHLANTVVLPDRIAMLEVLPGGGTVMECGVDRGDFSAQILQTCQPELLWLVDLWDSRRFSSQKLDGVRSRFEQPIAIGRVRISRKRSLDALREVPDRSLSWVYIDTSHDFETTTQELALAAEKVCDDGFICGHDYTVGCWESYTRYGVVEAVNQFCVEQNWELAMITNEARRHLSFALRRLSTT